MLGGFLALIAAATFAFNNASLRRGVLTGSAAQAMAITVPLGVLLFLAATLITGHGGAIGGFTQLEAGALALAGVVHFIWGRYCNYRATMAIGANLVAPVQQFALIVSLTLAVIVLGEVLTPLRVLGIALVILGPAFTLRQAREPRAPSSNPTEVMVEARPRAPFRPRYGEGYAFAVLSACGYGSSPILVRYAVEGKGVGGSLSAGVVAYASAAVFVLLALLWPGRLRHALSVTRESAKWFTLSGVLVSVSQMFTYMAMSIAPVSVVMPIQRLSMVFRIYFARLLTPDHEVFGAGIILGTFVSLTGAAILSLSTDVVLSLLPLPDGVTHVLRWQWP